MRFITRTTALPLCAIAMTIGVSASALAATPPQSMNVVISQPSQTPASDDYAVSNDGNFKLADRWDDRAYNRQDNRYWRGQSYGGNNRGNDNYSRRNRNGFNFGAAAGAFVGGVIVNGISRSQYRSAYQRCDDRYVSFRWSDGTFQPYGRGPRQVCSYLR